MTPRGTDCVRCGLRRAKFVLPTGPICSNCRRDLAYHPSVCPECLELRPVAYPSQNMYGVLVCARCADEPSIFACAECGREDHPYGHSRCARCILRERLTGLLTDPATRQIPETLQPLFDTLIASERPQTTIYWLRRPPGVGPRLLGEMAAGRMEISHHAFEQLPSDRAHHYLRELLTAVGILPHYEPAIARMLPWLDEQLAPLPREDALLVNRFARWRVLRHLRGRAERGELTKGTIDRGHAEIKEAIRFLTWLREHEATIDTAGQELLDRYLHRIPTRAMTLSTFLNWLPERRGQSRFVLPAHRPGLPVVTVSDEARWERVEMLLHDDSIRRYVRIVGLFTLLFAQPLTKICRMRTDQVLIIPGRVLVTFDQEPVEMPPILDDLIRAHLGTRGNASFASRDNGWLFPGGLPGRPLQTENVRAQLVDLGIKPHDNRKTALFQLAANIPTPVLADLIGIAPNTAVKWSALTARSWSTYIAQR